jgi:hypothetical protein
MIKDCPLSKHKYWERRGKVKVSSLDLSSRWSCVVRFTVQWLCPWEKTPWFPSERM